MSKVTNKVSHCGWRVLSVITIRDLLVLLGIGLAIFPCIALGQNIYVEIVAPPPTCTISGTDMSFGTLESPSADFGIATIDPTADRASAFTYTDGANTLTSSGVPTWATVSVTAKNSTGMEVSVTASRPAARCVASEDGTPDDYCGIAFEGAWAGSNDDSAAKFDSIEWTDIDRHNFQGSRWETVTRYYRLGGTISGINPNIAASQTMVTVSVMCV